MSDVYTGDLGLDRVDGEPLSQFAPVLSLTPLRITVLYVFFGFVLLFVSDVFLVQFLSEPLLGQLQALKGGTEIILTAGLIYLLTSHREEQLWNLRERVERDNTELEILHRVLRHNLRNDLNIILSHLELATVSDEQDEERFETIVEVLERMVRYTDQAKMIRRVTDRDEEVREFDLDDTIRGIIRRNEHIHGQVAVTTDLEDTRIEANYMLPEAISELLTNAVLHHDSEEPRIKVTIDHQCEKRGMVELRVSDDGPGIPSTEREPLELDSEKQMLHLSGLGLWFVKWAVELSGGDFSIEESNLGGTRVRILLPKAND